MQYLCSLKSTLDLCGTCINLCVVVVTAGLKIEGARREILHEDVLRQYMLPQHYDRLQDIKQYIQTGFIRQVRKDR